MSAQTDGRENPQMEGTPNASNSSFLNNIFVDGTTIPQQPDVAWGSGAYNKMPILGGSVKDDHKGCSFGSGYGPERSKI